MSFDDEIEIFDASAEFHDAEGVLRYRAQELGDDAKALKIIYEEVRGYVRAFDDLALWNPKADIDIEKGLDGPLRAATGQHSYPTLNCGTGGSETAFICP
ncbi:hypothetical protein [Rhizobium tibeticum]|uniref:hypothetical protein n=1 Tax=Rhizobium tibeticum TaxID=501024 RepID=UPI0009300957|nr:hypothetical protein [Rhizobium tibeticum]